MNKSCDNCGAERSRDYCSSAMCDAENMSGWFLKKKEPDYEPYGDRWKKEMMKMRKDDIVELLREAYIRLNNGSNFMAGDRE